MATHRAWLLNLDADDELAHAASGATSSYEPSRAVATRSARIAARLIEGRTPLVPAGDVVLGSTVEHPRDVPARAWCPTPRAFRVLEASGLRLRGAPTLEVLLRVNDRRAAIGLDPTPFPSTSCATEGAVRDAVREPPTIGTGWVLKRAFGFAGRGLRGCPPGVLADRAIVSWIREALRAGPVVVEPWVERLVDLALHGFVSNDGRVTTGAPVVSRVDGDGVWRESALALDDELSAAERAGLVETSRRAASMLVGAGYSGPFGVDAFRYRGSDGAPAFRACCELNARYTMAWAMGMGEQRPDLDG